MNKPFLGEKNIGLKIYLRLFSYARPYWVYFSYSIAGTLVYALSEPAFAALMKPIVDGSFIQQDPEMMRMAPLILIGLFFVRGIANFCSTFFSRWVGRKVIADLRQHVFQQLLQMPCAFYDHASSGNLLSQLLYNTEQVAMATTRGVITIVRDSLTLVGLLGLMFYLNPILSSIFLIVGPIISLGIWRISYRFRKISHKIQNSMAEVSHIAQEAIDLHHIVKVFQGQSYETERFATANNKNRQQQMKLIAAESISTPVIQFLYACAFGLILFLVSLDFIRKDLTLGGFIAFISAVTMLSRPIQRLANVNVLFQKGIAAGESIFKMLDEENEKDQGQQQLSTVKGQICYENITLSYSDQDKPALNQVSLTIRPGQTVAFVGQSGSGKSSLTRLLPRLYEPSAGQIKIDGVCIKDLTLHNLRSHIAYVGQEVALFNDTIANNIAYGCATPPTREQLIDAAIKAHALHFIERLPNGFDTLIGQQGIMLSGGQRQRLSIARAILKNAPILILDEATSALDTESEYKVQQALEELMKNKTTLVIAHRLSTIEKADIIFVMKEGKILEQGSHQNLLDNATEYSRLYRAQFSD